MNLGMRHFGDIFLRLFIMDVLFLPYFLPIPIPFSALLIPFWLLQTGPKISLREWGYSIAGTALVTVSYLLGLYQHVPDSELYATRFINSGILIYMFVSVVLLQRDSADNGRAMVQMLEIYLVFSVVLAVIFLIDTNLYFSLREQWTFSRDEIHYDTLTVLVRYTGILSDPNNMAASTCAIAALLVFLEPQRILRNSVLISMTAIVVVTSMSVTGLICFGILAGSFIFLSNFMPTFAQNLVMRFLATGALLIMIAALYFSIKDQAVFQLALERIDASDVDSRLSRWLIVFDYDKIVSSILFGDGGSIFWQARDYRPHNGHLYLVFAFGIFSYLAFMKVFFRFHANLGIANIVFLVILMLIFTVNVGVYEHRFSGIWVILSALYFEASRLQSKLDGTSVERLSVATKRRAYPSPVQA